MFQKPEVVSMTGPGSSKQVLLRTSDGKYKLFAGSLAFGRLAFGIQHVDRDTALEFFAKSETKLVSELQ